MRVVLAIVTVVLTLGAAARPLNGQMQGDLETIHMVDRQTGWALTDVTAEERVLLRSTDGGSNWRDVTPRNPSGQKIRVFRIATLSSEIAWVISSGTVNGPPATEVFRTTSGGHAWTGTTIPAASVTSISFINSHEGWLLASLGAAMVKEEVEIYHSTDGGATWNVVARSAPKGNSGLPFRGDKSSITFVNSTTGWITGADLHPDSLYLYVTRDGGRTWRKQDLPLPRLPKRKQNPSKSTEMRSYWEAHVGQPRFFGTHDGILRIDYVHYIQNDSTLNEQVTGIVVVYYVTHDAGITWAYTVPVPIRNIGDRQPNSFADMNHGWVKEGDILHVTSDGGKRWTTIRPGPIFADVAQLHFVSPRIGWAVRNTTPRLLRTTDGGRTWNPVSYTISR